MRGLIGAKATLDMPPWAKSRGRSRVCGLRVPDAQVWRPARRESSFTFSSLVDQPQLGDDALGGMEHR